MAGQGQTISYKNRRRTTAEQPRNSHRTAVGANIPRIDAVIVHALALADTYKHPRVPPKLITGFQINSCPACSCRVLRKRSQVARASPMAEPLGFRNASLTVLQATFNRAITARHQRLCARCPYSCRYLKFMTTKPAEFRRLVHRAVAHSITARVLDRDGPEWVVIGAQKAVNGNLFHLSSFLTISHAFLSSMPLHTRAV